MEQVLENNKNMLCLRRKNVKKEIMSLINNDGSKR